MYVKDHMTKNPVCISPDTSVSKALELMQQGKFHRIPVTDQGRTSCRSDYRRCCHRFQRFQSDIIIYL
jgi:CBS domain-containing protein